MELMTTEFHVEDHEKLYAAAMLAGCNIKKMFDIKIYIVTRRQYNYIADRIAENCIVGKQAYTIMLYEKELYIYFSGTRDITFDIEVLIQAYVLAQYGNAYNNITIHNIMNDNRRIFNSIQSNYDSITNLSNDIKVLEAKLPISIKLPNIKEFMNACKHLKIKCSPYDDGFVLDFGKCKSGNQTEGYVNYNSIVVYMESSLRIKRIVMYFTKFMYDSDWGWEYFSFHPHIKQNHICMGNREQDYAMYRNGFHYEFFLELLKSTFNNYSEDGPPYISILSLAAKIASLNKATAVMKCQLGKLSNEEMSKKLFTTPDYIKSCRYCNGIIFGEHCETLQCQGNPEAIVSCDTCDARLERVPYTFGSDINLWNCPEETCRRHRDITDVNIFVHNCVNCNTLLRPTSMYTTDAFYTCENIGHANLRARQYDNYGNYIGFSDIIPQEALHRTPICVMCGHEMIQNENNRWFCNNCFNQYPQLDSDLMRIFPTCPNCRRAMTYERAEIFECYEHGEFTFSYILNHNH